jgi:AcrR family transcriptional regulator
VTVRAVMAETTLSRNAFYLYFRDRYELIAALVARLRQEADTAMAGFTAGSDRAAGREAIASAARLYASHGELLRALSQAAATDPSAARAWAEFVEPSHRLVTERVEEEIRAGRIVGIADPERVVRALVAMNRACFFDQLVGRPEADIDAIVDALYAVWMRTLYGVSTS